MLYPRVFSTVMVATALVIIGALAPDSVPAQAPAQPQAPNTPQPRVKPGPYKAVAVTPPTPMSDASFDEFRKQLAGIAQKRDRAALAPLVAASFFWIPGDRDVADPSKPAIDNLAEAVGLDGQDAPGWVVIFDYAAGTTAMPNPEHPGVICAPARPAYDEKAADELLDATQTETSDWVYPLRDGVEVYARPLSRPPVVDKLGLHLVRVLVDDANADSFLKVITPSGKTGYVAEDAIRDLEGPQMCYVKDEGGWKIAGLHGSY